MGQEPREVELSVGLMEAALAQGASAGFSEDVLAQAFVAMYGSRLRFDHTSGQWFEWDGSRWQLDRRRRALDFARRICRAHGNTARLHKASVAAGVEKLAASDPLISRCSDDWDRDPMLLGTPRGTVDLRTGHELPADPEDGIRRSTAVAPAAGEPKLWLSFLGDATGGDEELIRFLQRVMGYSLTGLTHEHALFFLHGPGGNGKSVCLNTLTGIMGSYAETAMMDTFIASRTDRHPTELATLAGARLVTASETQQGRSWDETRIKQMTGGDPITARFMRRDPFTYDPQFKLVIVGNHEPLLRNVDEAMRRRFNIIRFWHTPPVKDPLLEQKLEAEYPQMLQWMIEGCLEWQREGLKQPDSVKQSTASYFEDQDVIGQWIEACCHLDPGHFETTDDLYSSYERFAHDSGEYPLKKRGLGIALRQRPGVREHRSCGSRGYLGLRLTGRASESRETIRSAADDDDDELMRP